ncbi:peptidylprolyl isomerase [Longimicrobium sp.]|uniref:peptidylprolyl isomerase n=1 Tax=Longimicrobium sp. TaxID=2029185 RepID=UPI002E3466D4|nr:peptidylprolyl isomerase [Longimicrobium sp.]HEX6037934.1 peptidylprolyl isomerase [Longimicrobium sp.]
MNMHLRLAAAALLLAACAPAARSGAAAPSSPTAAPAPDADPVTDAGLLRLADRREWNEPYLRAAAGQPALARRAAWVMANLRRSEAVPLLVPLLTGGDTATAAMAAFALGQIGDSTAVPHLVPLVDVASIATRPTVVGEAAMALGKLRGPGAKEAVTMLLADAPGSGPGVREAVGQALLGIWRQPRPLPVEAVAPWLDSQDAEIRWRAAYALARRAEPAATTALFRNQRDPDALVRSLVARSLSAAMADSSRVGADAAQDALYRMVTHDTSLVVRINALRSLGSYRTERALVILREMVEGGRDPYEVITAMESLQRMGTFAAAAAPVLQATARDTTAPVSVRQTAVAALGVVDPPAARRVVASLAGAADWRLRASAARVLAADSGAAEHLARLLADPDGRVGAAALEAALAADTTGLSIRGALVQGLAHPDPILRVNALGGIARLRDTTMLGAVLDAYDRAGGDEMNDARLAAVEALGVMAERDPRTARAFFARFSRADDYLVRQRVHALFGDTVPGAWGPPLPIETGLETAEYARVAADAAAHRRPRAVIETNRGRIEVELFADDAPLTVRNFLSLAERGFFDGQEWPRVVPNFVIQGGDPRGDTSGGPGYSIRDEINRHTYLRGTLGMALSGPDTGGSQWFITHSPQPHLDGTYTVFGRVVRGMEAVDDVLPGDRIIRIREVK